MAIWDRNDNWLAGIGESDHPNHSIRGTLGTLTAATALAAFEATYGKGRFKVTDHGGVLTVWYQRGYAELLRDYARRSRERGDEDRAKELEGRAAEEENREVYSDDDA